MAEWLAGLSPGPGLLILDGLVVVNVRVEDRVAAELVGAGDLISNALARLARAGVVTGHDDDWHLHGRLVDQLDRMNDRAAAEYPVGLGAFSSS